MTTEANSAEKSGPIAFIRQVRQEMARVTWPTRRETMMSAVMVFVMVVVCSVFLFFADQIIAFIVQLILG